MLYTPKPCLMLRYPSLLITKILVYGMTLKTFGTANMKHDMTERGRIAAKSSAKGVEKMLVLS